MEKRGENRKMPGVSQAATSQQERSSESKICRKEAKSLEAKGSKRETG